MVAESLPLTETSLRAQRQLEDCHLCPFHCGIARASGAGVCRVGGATHVASEMLHLGEEQLLSPAHAIFFSGCTARCSFCIAARFAFRPDYGLAVSSEQLAERIVMRQNEGARSICFIGGDPVPHIPFILETLAALGTRKRVPSVFNSNFYLTDTALDLLQGPIDIYLPDLKFGPGKCGENIGTMPDYWQIVTGCIDRVLLHGEQVIVRHLLMPGHLHCCTEPVLGWLADRPGIQVSLLDQYVPPAHARDELATMVSARDSEAAWNTAHRLGIELVD
jgi:putative pyruvate formate lyase activating enzyme